MKGGNDFEDEISYIASAKRRRYSSIIPYLFAIIGGS